jgi:hypothetical protein
VFPIVVAAALVACVLSLLLIAREDASPRR